jgi:murein DD-endopeptidase MepM/ murein hydrolase activator NlpD
MGKSLTLYASVAVLCALSACASSPEPVLLETAAAPSARFLWPMDLPTRAVSSEFGVRGGHGKSRDFHRGLDISAPRGTPVRAVAPGIVAVAGNGNGYGLYIVVNHGNGMSTLYAHLLDFAVHRGDRVDAGEILGRVGKSGNATGYHLHFEVRRETQPVDPRSYLP